MRFEDENQYDDEADDEDEYDGYTVVDDEGNELTVSRKTDKKAKDDEENWDDGEIPDASPIPQNEQTVMLDNVNVEDLEVGQALDMVLDDCSAAVFFGTQRVGDFKPAFVKKLKEERGGMYAAVELASVSAPVLVRLTYYSNRRKNAVRIDNA